MKPRERIVFDSYALLMYLNDEPGSEEVTEILGLGKENKLFLYMNEVNLGEVFYRIGKAYGLGMAEQKISEVRALTIEWVLPDSPMILAAARFKARYPISYADGFSAATCLRVGGHLLTGDPEFKALEHEIDVHWLPPKKSS
ncbi:MAG: type II toxin-antitoxin system VapC family toxin [bacterium]